MDLKSRNHAWAALLAVALVAPDASAAGSHDLAVDFGSRGLWWHVSSGWVHATNLDPVVLAPWNDRFAVSFRTGLGLWSYDGTSWAQLAMWDPYDAVAWNGDLVAAFDSGRGLWLWSSSSWSQLTPWEPVQLEAQDGRLLASFGPGKGLWIHESGSWRELTPWQPERFVLWGDRVAASFDSGRGIWLHDGSSWRQLTHWEASTLTIFDEGLAMSLEPELGLWLYDGVSFSQLTSWQPYALVGTADGLIAAFDEGRGIWRYRSSTGWTQLSVWEPIHVEAVSTGVVADFGHGRGLWIHDGVNAWTNLTTWNGEQLESKDPSHRGAEDPLDVGSDVPDLDYCQDVRFWNPAWRRLEDEILQIVNQRRSEGASCGSEGTFGSTLPVTADPALRCAARVHSKDMVERAFFSHTNPDGENPWDRFSRAGYSFSAAGENIAGGYGTAAATMGQWMASDGHCANVMNPSFSELGVGYYPGGLYRHYWTQGFARPR